MKKKSSLTFTFIKTSLVLIALLSVLLAALLTITGQYVILGTRLYPKGQRSLDLRGDELTTADYEKLSRLLPGTELIWDVPFQGKLLPSTTRSLQITALTAEDADMLAYFPQLETVDAAGCADTEALAAAAARYPGVTFQYTLVIDGQTIAPDARSVTITHLTEEDARRLESLPRLQKIDASACRDYNLLLMLKDAHPEWEILYTHSIAGQELDRSAVSFEITGAGCEELSAGLAYMKDLQTVLLHEPAADADALLQLRSEYPSVSIHWDCTLNGRVYGDDTRELDLSDSPLESIAEAKAAAAPFPELGKLILDSGAIPDADMAAFREEMRGRYLVVWTVKFSKNYSARTDTDWIMPTKEGEYYFSDSMAEKLIYMEDVVAMDLGHHPIHNTDFLKYMPKLTYLVLSHTNIQYVTNIEYCKELLFLEIDYTYVRDLGSITQCTKLEDLSICAGLVDTAVLSQLTWLKNLRWRENTAAARSLIEALPDTCIQLAGYDPGPLRWRELPNYYASRDILGMYYMEEY